MNCSGSPAILSVKWGLLSNLTPLDALVCVHLEPWPKNGNALAGISQKAKTAMSIEEKKKN